VKVCFVGAGAIGTFLGVHLARSDWEVSTIARGSTAAALRSHGLRLLSGFGKRRVGTFQNRSAANRLLLSERFEAELLAANTRFEHEAPLTGGEDRHAVLVFGVRRRTLGRGHRACLSRQR